MTPNPPGNRRLSARRPRGHRRARRDDLAGRAAGRDRDPAPLLPARARLSPRRQLPRLHGRDRGRARARRLVHPQADARHAGHDRLDPRRSARRDGLRAARWPTSRPRAAAHDPDSTFWRWADQVGVASSRFPARRPPPARPQPPGDGRPARRLHPVQPLRPRLPRGPGQRRHRHGRARGRTQKVVFDFDDPMGQSTCVACGECVQACPTGALMPAVGPRRPGPQGPRPRPEGREPLPLLRRRLPADVPDPRRRIALRRGPRRPGQPQPALRQGPVRLRLRPPPAPADAPLDPQAGRAQGRRRPGRPGQPLDPLPRGDLGRGARRRGAGAAAASATATGGRALAGFGSAKGSNEEAYLFQKLVRTGFGSNNVDHCTRLCHASSVAALMETIGSGAVTAPFAECAHSDVIVVIGANPTVNHPVAATFIKNAAEAGATLIVIDPRGQALSRHATHRLAFRPGTDVALLNALIHVIIAEGLYDRGYVEAHHRGVRRAARRTSRASRPEAMAPLCGIDAGDAPRGRPALRDRQGGDDLLGHGDLAARPRHRQRPLPDLPGAVDRQRRPARDGPAPAPRAEQRAGGVRRRPDPDGLPRLPAGRPTRRIGPCSRTSGARRSTPSPA